jgi:hypothetical protein
MIRIDFILFGELSTEKQLQKFCTMMQFVIIFFGGEGRYSITEKKNSIKAMILVHIFPSTTNEQGAINYPNTCRN